MTGGTGTFGHAFVKRVLECNPHKVIVYSRDEFKQFNMSLEINDDRVRYSIGDVRDEGRISDAMRGVDYVVHAAALKQVPSCEYNPIEAVRTNVLGAANVVRAAILNRVKKVVALSTDKAVQPLNLYGATKACSDRIFIASNNLSGAISRTEMMLVRYGNVAKSRGSVIPLFMNMVGKGAKTLPLTHHDMTRFYITIDEAVDLVFKAFEVGRCGEIFVKKIPSFLIRDCIASMGCTSHIVGIRPGEKIHEIMITQSDAPRTYDMGEYYIIVPELHAWEEQNSKNAKRVPNNFEYSSGDNTMMTISEIREALEIG